MTPDPATLPPLFVLRHGETEWNRARRLQGRLDSPLTPRGRDQAAAQGRILARSIPEDAAARVSPAGRTRATAEIALHGLGLAAVADARLLELDLGRWQGLSFDEIAAAHPGIGAEEDGVLWEFMAPGGERLEQMAARLSAVLAELDRPTVLITHGITSRMLRCLALGIAPERLDELPGGQGVVHRIANGHAETLRDDGP